jgi:hypothetical protein
LGAPIIIDDNMDLWIQNGHKDIFCEMIVAGAKLQGLDISEVYEIAPGIAGSYNISGLGIDTEEFYPYFGGRDGFRAHLDFCSDRIEALCDLNEEGCSYMSHIFAWAKHIMDGGVCEDRSPYLEWPNS